MEKLKKKSVGESVRRLLMDSFVGGQGELCEELAKQGHDVTQSTVSRVLKKLGAVRTYNSDQQAFYVLPSDDALPPVHASIIDLVQEIVANETLVVVNTKPGSASLIARHIDFNGESVLGTVAGDDCFFVVPKTVKNIEQTISEVQSLLGWQE